MAAGQSCAASYFSASAIAARDSSCPAGEGESDGTEGCGTCSAMVGTLGVVDAEGGGGTALCGEEATWAGLFILKNTTPPATSNKTTTIARTRMIAQDGFLAATGR